MSILSILITKKIKSRILLKFLLLTLCILLLFIINQLFAVPTFAQARDHRQRVQSQPEEDNIQISCLEQGKEFFFQQEYDEAIEQLENCLEEDADNPEIYYFIGQSYFQQGQDAAQNRSPIKAYRYYRRAYEVSDTAIEKYQQQIEENPGEEHTNQYLQLAYIYQIRSLIPGVNEYQEALDIYQELLEVNPHIVSAYYHMGWIYYQQEDYRNAIEVYSKYLDAGRRSDFVYYHLGLSYDKIDERQKAEYYFQLILEEFPDTEMADRAKKELE